MSSTPSTANGNSELSPAQRLMQQHQSHNPTIEDAVDEEDLKHEPTPSGPSILESTDEAEAQPGWVAPTSANAAGKRKANPAPRKENTLDTQSDALFPGLGSAPKAAPAAVWNVGKTAAGNYSNGTNGSSTPNSGVSTPAPGTTRPHVPGSLAGNIEAPLLRLHPQEVLSGSQLKKPIPHILKEINKKYRTNLAVSTGAAGVLEFREQSNQKEAIKQQAIRDLGAQICAKTSAKVSIPRSSRAHIIGKQGATIKSLQESTGARIQMPKSEDTPARAADDDDDDDMIDIVVEGTPIAISQARKAIDKITNERGTPASHKLRNIPAEFYPFLSASAASLENSHGVQVRVPPYDRWTSQPPPERPSSGLPVFLPAAGDNHITLAGDRAAVLAARAELERKVEQLRLTLAVDQFSANQSSHQFIIGKRGVSAEKFFDDTQCAIIMPGIDDEETITIVGPSDLIEQAVEHAQALAEDMRETALKIAAIHKTAPGGARVHARNVTQYLRERKELERIEKNHGIFVATPTSAENAGDWTLHYRDSKKMYAARADFENLVAAHPPSRMSTVPVDDFYHAYLRKEISPKVKQDFGVHLVLPEAAEPKAPVLLVYEGEEGTQAGYQAPRTKPSPQEVKAFQQGLADARAHILEIISQQASILEETVDVPKMFHEKLRRFIQKEQQARPAGAIPVRVHPNGTVLTLRGPAPACEALTAKVKAFVAQAIEDEKERGFTLTFDFPQKHANQLIGKGGSNIRELREKYDVEIQVNDGVVELKGPKAKAEAAKAHITASGRQWADEATYTLKVEPKYHAELIGKKGEQINRLQTRYKVQIHFPRSAKPAKDDQTNVDAASEAGKRGPRREQQPDEVIVKGPKKGADEARDEILSLLQYLKDNSYTASVSVQSGQIPALIGQRGAQLDELRQASGAKIDIPNARDEDPTTRVEITVRGTKSQVAQAKKLLDDKRQAFDDTVTKTLEVEKRHHRALIGTGGATLRDIVVSAGGSDDRRELARTVQFPKAENDGNTIKLEGNSVIVEKIIAAMQKIVAERESQDTAVIEVPTNKHRSLIGRGGETKKGLESKFSVSIDIPRQGSEQTGIKITGLPADVEKAKAHILDLVKDQEGETVQVPRNVHHAIADNGQFFRRMRNDHDVTVDHDGHKLPPKPSPPGNTRTNGGRVPLITDEDEAEGVHSFNVVDNSQSAIEGDIPWILRGPSDNLAKARATLLAAIEQASKNTTIGYLTLPDPSTYRYVIGQGGKKVNSIRNATGCKITVPREQGSEEAIEIVGSAEGVNKARDLILEAVKEGSNNTGSRGAGGYAQGPSSNTNGNENWD